MPRNDGVAFTVAGDGDDVALSGKGDLGLVIFENPDFDLALREAEDEIVCPVLRPS